MKLPGQHPLSSTSSDGLIEPPKITYHALTAPGHGKFLGVKVWPDQGQNSQVQPIMLLREQAMEFYRLTTVALEAVQEWEATACNYSPRPELKRLGCVQEPATFEPTGFEFGLYYHDGICCALIRIVTPWGCNDSRFYSRASLENLVETLTPLLKLNGWLPKKKSGNGTSTLN